MTLPDSDGDSMAIPPDTQVASPGFSKEFTKAGVEEMTAIREWRSALVKAVQSGFPLTDEIVARFRSQALGSDAMTSAAASTDSDRSAYVSKVLDKTQNVATR